MRSSWYNKLVLIVGPRPRVHWLLVCLVSALVLIALLGSSSSNSFDSVTASARPDIYSNYRRLKEQAVSDYLELKNLGANRVKDFDLCGREKENYVPCYNVSANLLAGFKDGEEFDRHCEVSRDQQLMLLEENQISFHSDDELIDGVKDYSHQIAEMIGLGSDSEFREAGVRNVLDIGCGFGSFGAHLLSLKLMAICMAAYESTGSQVQLALERGLPAIIGNFISRQLPVPSLSYDMVHCTQCGIFWDDKDGMFLIEVDRVLKPGGYFVLTSPRSRQRASKGKIPTPFEEFTQKLCWNLVAQQEETFIWQKTTDSRCYVSRQGTFPFAMGKTAYHTINHLLGINPEDFSEDLDFWRSALRNYWSLLSPLIFSDHPKRPGDEDPMPPYNMVRNVMDMSAHYGGLNTALLEAKKSVWVMNVVPLGERNTLPVILDQGFAGVLHNWCEPFPTYPRTYDMLHAKGLLSHIASGRCSIIDLLLEMDRILRPEGWIIISDKLGPVEIARTLATQLRWEARVIDLQNGSDERLLVCQKPFVRK
ncbi:UNVERIFIED_CONTAM: putative methyltransferase PMT5 [Sesamum radiatum]|uniref:Methyltransferase n=1 Tax=Sesamum radiatum TaxID=300843 RepID=A0AAW2MZA1_SESRA